MTIIFDNELTIETVSELICSISEANLKDSKHSLYFSSSGGDCAAAKVLVHYLNNNCLEWKLMAHNEIYSAAFDVYYSFQGNKEILENTILMFHLPTFTLNTREITENSKNLQRAWIDLNNDNIKYLKLLKKIKLPKNYIKEVKKGKDVYIYNNDIKRLKL